MKNIFAAIAFVLLSSIILFSCTKKEPVVAFTNATMKPWFDKYCASCHASGASDANKWLYDAADFNNSIKKHISSINSEVASKKSMPQGTALSNSELQAFINWYAAGYPVN